MPQTPSQEIPGSGYPIVTTRMPGEIIARAEPKHDTFCRS